MVVLYPVFDSVILTSFYPGLLEKLIFRSSFAKADFHHPAGIVQRIDRHAPLMLPIAITPLQVPFFQQRDGTFHWASRAGAAGLTRLTPKVRGKHFYRTAYFK